MNNLKKQMGMSLIELLIAMLIGLFLLSGIASSYISSKRTSTERDQISSVEDNGRLALEVISKTIEHAGYLPPNPGADPQFKPFIEETNDVLSALCTDGSKSVVDIALFSSDRVVADNPSGDSLAVIYYSDSRIFQDCGGGVLPVSCRLAALGATPKAIKPEASRIYNSFYLDTANNQLMCAGSRSSKSELIAEGVENIQYLYGVEIGENGVKRYMNATNLALSGLWKKVVSIQVAVLVRSLKPVKRKAESKTYTLLDQSVVTNSDRFSRAVFSTTIHLRNNSN